MTDTNHTIKINVDTKDAAAVLKALAAIGKDTGDKVSRGGQSATDAWSVFKGALGANLIVDAFKKIGSAASSAFGTIVDKTAEMETIETQLATMTGSIEGAKLVLEDLTKFAATTPFEMPGIANSAKQLIAFGFDALTVTDRLRSIGDVASGSGSELADITQIFGQVSAAGKLTGERLLQLQERAIPIGPALAKTMGVAESAVRDMVSNGKVDFATFEKAFNSLSQEGGIFFNGMVKQSQTLSGVLSTLSDDFGLTAADVGRQFLPVMKDIVSATSKFIAENREMIKSLASTAATNFAASLTTLSTALKNIVAFSKEHSEALKFTAVALGVAGTAYAVYTTAVKIATAASAAFQAIAFWPIAAFAAVGAAVAGVIIYWDELSETFYRAKAASIEALDAIGMASEGMKASAAAARQEADAIRANIEEKKRKKSLDEEEEKITLALASAKTEAAKQAILASRSQGLVERMEAEATQLAKEEAARKDVEAQLAAKAKKIELVQQASKEEQDALKKHQETIAEMKLEERIAEEELRLQQLTEEQIRNDEALVRLIEQLGKEEALKKQAALNALAAQEQTTAVVRQQEEIRLQIQIDAHNRAIEDQKRTNDGLMTLEQERLKKLQEQRQKDAEDARRLRDGELKWFMNTKDREAEWTAKTERDKLMTIQDGFRNIAYLSKSKNKELAGIGQAAAIVETTINTYRAATAAYAALAGIPIVGPVLGAAAAAGAITFGLHQVDQIRSQRFANGGIVAGNSLAGDSVPVLANSGELILNKAQQNSIAGQLGSGSSREVVAAIKENTQAIRELRFYITDTDIFDATNRVLLSGRRLG